MLDKLTGWLLDVAIAAFKGLWDFVADVVIALFDLLLTALATLLAAIPLPQFITTGMQGLFGGLGGDILYLLSASGLASAMAMIGAAYTFRLARKFVTLFQW